MVASGRIRQILYSVYVDDRRRDDLSVRLSAIQRVRPPDAVIGRRTAAWLRGVSVPTSIGDYAVPAVECIVPPDTTPIRRPGVRCFRAPLHGDVEEVQGVPCTTSLRTAVDLLRYLPPHLALGAADAMAHAGLFDVGALCVETERWGGGRNIRQARRLASFCEPATESYGESWTRLRILDAGFPRPRVQIPLERDGRTIFRLDLGFEGPKLGLEYDGQEFHTDLLHRLHDERRRAQILREFGWRVLAVGRGEVLGTSLAFERGIGELLGMEPQITRRLW